VLQNDDGENKELAPRQFVLNRGYAITSYSAQGKTATRVIIADSENKLATNAKSWYVSLSRGRKSAHIFTSSKASLKESIQNLGDKPLAMDLDLTPPKNEGLKQAPPPPSFKTRQKERIRYQSLRYASQRMRALYQKMDASVRFNKNQQQKGPTISLWSY